MQPLHFSLTKYQKFRSRRGKGARKGTILIRGERKKKNTVSQF